MSGVKIQESTAPSNTVAAFNIERSENELVEDAIALLKTKHSNKDSSIVYGDTRLDLIFYSYNTTSTVSRAYRGNSNNVVENQNRNNRTPIRIGCTVKFNSTNIKATCNEMVI